MTLTDKTLTLLTPPQETLWYRRLGVHEWAPTTSLRDKNQQVHKDVRMIVRIRRWKDEIQNMMIPLGDIYIKESSVDSSLNGALCGFNLSGI